MAKNGIETRKVRFLLTDILTDFCTSAQTALDFAPVVMACALRAQIGCEVQKLRIGDFIAGDRSTSR